MFATRFAGIAQRSFATAAPKSNMVGGKTMSQIWLSDKTTYPIMVIIAGACALSVYTMVVQTAKKADIRVMKDRRSQVIRDWQDVKRGVI